MSKDIDWDAVEIHYRANIKSLRIIGDEYGITEGAIRKRAKKYGWVRDLKAKIKARAEDLVRKAEVRSLVRSETAATEQEQIEIGAEIQKTVILGHRKVIGRAMIVVERLVTELESFTFNVALYDELGELMHNPDKTGKDRLGEMYRAVVGFHGRVDSAKKLAESIRYLSGLEREAYGIDNRHDVEGLEHLQSLRIGFVAEVRLEAA